MAKTFDRIKSITKRIFELEDVHSVLVFGSAVKEGLSSARDIDICVVAPNAREVHKLANIISGMLPRELDVVVFELLPLYMKIEVINNHVILHTRSKLELYEYFYKFRKIWRDQEYRQRISSEEAKKLFKKGA